MPQPQPIDDVSVALEEALGITPEVAPVDENLPADGELSPEAEQLPGEEDAEEEVPLAEGEFELPDSIDIKEFAELAGVDVDYLYNNMTMTSANGDVISIGEWKDNLKEQAQGGNLQQQQQDILAQQQHMQAQAALREQYGEPIRRYQDALQEITEKYKSTNWKELTDAHGDKAELARVQMQQRYSQIQNELGRMTGEYEQALGGYATQIAQHQLQEIVKTHPTWTDQASATTEMQEIHKAIASTGITYEQMINEIGGMGGSVKLAILELAARGASAGNISHKKVRTVAKSLRGGRTISAQQQKRMQRAKSLKAARGGTRKQQQQAAIDLIAANGGI